MEQRARLNYQVRVEIAPGPVEVEFYFHGGPANGQQHFVPLDQDGQALMQVGVATPVQTIFGTGLLRSVYAFAPDGCYHWVGDIVG
jgi:hypothetical protein